MSSMTTLGSSYVGDLRLKLTLPVVREIMAVKFTNCPDSVTPLLSYYTRLETDKQGLALLACS